MKLGLKIFVIFYCTITFAISIIAIVRSFPVERRSEELIIIIRESKEVSDLNNSQIADIDLQKYIITSMGIVRKMAYCIFVSSSVIVFLSYLLSKKHHKVSENHQGTDKPSSPK